MPGAPVQPGRGRRWPRMLVAVGLCLLVLAGLAVVGGSILLRSYDRAVGRDNLLGPGTRTGSGAVVGPLNYLLIGSDYRTRNPDNGQRSDTIIIAHIDRTLNHAYLISVPRDLKVTIPADPATTAGPRTTKINAAFDLGGGGAGGARLLSQTLTDLVGIRFDGAASIQFDGLKGAVDLLGGVPMCVDTHTVSIHTHRSFPVGCRLMNATDALDYLRQRNFADGDFARQRHEQQFLKAFLNRAGQTGVLSNPLRLDPFLRSLSTALTVDTGGASLPNLVGSLRGIHPDNLTGVKVPSYTDMVGGVSYVEAGPDAASMFQAIRDDTLDTWLSGHREWVNQL